MIAVPTSPVQTQPVVPPARTSLFAAIGFSALTLFEVALALGAPLGRFAMGGQHTVLPPSLRIAAVAAACFWTVATLVVLKRGGYPIRFISGRVATKGTWALTGLLAVGVLMNLASRSEWERIVQTPVALTLLGLCIAVARSDSRESPVA